MERERERKMRLNQDFRHSHHQGAMAASAAALCCGVMF